MFSQKPCRASSNIEVALLKLKRFHTLYTIKKRNKLEKDLKTKIKELEDIELERNLFADLLKKAVFGVHEEQEAVRTALEEAKVFIGD